MAHTQDRQVALNAQAGVLGVQEGTPVAWVIAQVTSPPATNVRVRFADGAIEEMHPIQGIAVLTHPLRPAALPQVVGSVEALDRNRHTLASGDALNSASTGTFLQPSAVACNPQPTFLPRPNGPPPKNSAQARQQIVQDFDAVYQASTSTDQKLGLIDDPTNLDAAFQQARQNFAQALQNKMTRINDVRFLNATQALVFYDIVIPNYSIPEFPNRIGRVLLTHGTWKVTRATICTDLQLAAVTCSP
jgi:hypothetical protein